MLSPPPLVRKSSVGGMPPNLLLPVELIDGIIEEAVSSLEPTEQRSLLRPLALVSHTFAALANRRLHASHCIVLDFPSQQQYYDRINSITDLLKKSLTVTNVGAIFHLKRLIIFAEGKRHITHLFMDVLESPDFIRLLSLLHAETHGIRELEFQLELGLTDVWRWTDFPRLGNAIAALVRSPTLRTLKINNLRGLPRSLFSGTNLQHLSLTNIRAQRSLDGNADRITVKETEGKTEDSNYSRGGHVVQTSCPLLLNILEVDDVTGLPIDLLHFDDSIGIWDRYDEALRNIQEMTFRTEFGGTLFALRDFVDLISQIKMPLLTKFRAVVAKPFCCRSSPTPSFDFGSLRHLRTLTIETDSEEYMSAILTKSRFHSKLSSLQMIIRASLVRTETCRYLARTLSKLPAIQGIKNVVLEVECAVVLPLFDEDGDDFSGKWISELPPSFQFRIRQHEPR
ncbi:hypothetical protein CVT24_009438 [Panaeolus cyanescens]|uniref:Uncharacterized protein n=1 Tax=Panaeolus cyanescens TaxID=181874 RepID=A0A409W3P4_9AGAR|nr:hypothetical protein CVT24_009438 [Panaeolus cyanescens]